MNQTENGMNSPQINAYLGRDYSEIIDRSLTISINPHLYLKICKEG